MENELETFLMCDQPVNCPECGARTDFKEVSEDESIGIIQIHQCLDEMCRYKFAVMEY